jgi:hypothetical protein
MHCSQLAVWRKRGSGSPESLCKFGSFAPVRAAVKAATSQSRVGVIVNSERTVSKKQKTNLLRYLEKKIGRGSRKKEKFLLPLHFENRN